MTALFRCPHCACPNVLTDRRAEARLICRVCGCVVPVGGGREPAVEHQGVEQLASPWKEKREMPILLPSPVSFVPQLARHIERTIGPSPMVFHDVVAGDMPLT